MDIWTLYGLSLAALVASHGVLSAPHLRDHMLRRLGRRWFYIIHSLISTLALLGFVLAYRATPAGEVLFVPPDGMRLLIVLVMPILVFMLIARLTTPWEAEGRWLEPCGIYRITRSPGSLAIAVWAGLHLLNSGDTKRVLMFACLLLIALIALIKHEIVLARADAPGAELWRIGTSTLPFMGRGGVNAPPVMAQISLWQPALALTITLVLLILHPLLFGPDPLAHLRALL